MELDELTRKVDELSKIVNFLVQDLPEKEIFKFSGSIAEWKPGVSYGGEGEDRYVSIADSGRLAHPYRIYRCIRPHVSKDGFPPHVCPNLWSYVDRTRAGTLNDPILAQASMEYLYGRYYLDPDDKGVYLCKRVGGPEGGAIILQGLPHELIGDYFEEVI